MISFITSISPLRQKVIVNTNFVLVSAASLPKNKFKALTLERKIKDLKKGYKKHYSTIALLVRTCDVTVIKFVDCTAMIYYCTFFYGSQMEYVSSVVLPDA
jgi:hypothetical protein